MSGALLLVLIPLLAAVLCIALGTLRGSWRVWLVGYALAVVALLLAYGGLRSGNRGGGAAPAPPSQIQEHRP